MSLKAYVLLNSVKPRLGKLSNPHESPIPLKNHLKQLQTKLMLKYFPRQLTCFLLKIIKNKYKLGNSLFVNSAILTTKPLNKL
jgi:hypothetical protein